MNDTTDKKTELSNDSELANGNNPSNEVEPSLVEETTLSEDGVSEVSSPQDDPNVDLDEDVEDNDEQSSFEAMTEIALDSAEAANQAAESANASAELIIASVQSFNESMTGVQKKQNIMFWVFAGLFVVSVSVSAVLLERFTQSAIQADEIMLTVGKRVIQMDADVKRMAKMRDSLDNLNETNVVLNMQVTEAIGRMRDYEKEAQLREETGIKRTQDVLDRISNRLDVKFEKFTGTVANLENNVKKNAIRIEKANDELSELTISINEMKDQKLIDKLEALIQLEQTRYYEKMNSPSNAAATKSAADVEPCVPKLGFTCPK